MNTKYKYIPGYENRYAISKEGEIISFIDKEPLILKQMTSKYGYKVVALYDSLGYKVHHGGVFRTVASVLLETWGPEKPTPKHKVGYRDGDKNNMSLDNLFWTTRSEMLTKVNITRWKKYKTGIVE